MKILRYLLAVTVLCGLSAVANAAPVNFQVVVIDPPSLPGFTVIGPSTQQPINVNWGGCALTPAPTFDDCFVVFNQSGQDITSLSLFIPNTTNTSDNPCPDFSNASLDLFSLRSCGPSNGGFLLNFAGGTIPSGDGDFDWDDFHSFLVIAVDINGDGTIPNALLAVNGRIATTPEPNSLLLLFTGLLSGGGLLLGDWRRRIVGKPTR